MPARPAGHRHDAQRLVADIIADTGATAVDTAIVTASPELAISSGILAVIHRPAHDSKGHTTSSLGDCAVMSLADLTLRRP
jgi:hypothetical protein